ncbi:MAG: hypothetical protein AB7E47_08305 [Desulfovibrionaceae bacterium]
MNMQTKACRAGCRLAWVCCCLALLASLAGCATNGANQLQTKEAASEVSFFDSFSFDRQLSNSLRAGFPQVSVVFPATITINSIPPRLEKWLSVVEQGGGKVTLVPVRDGEKGILSEVLSLFVKVIDYIKEKAIYSPATGYDLELHYKQGSGIVLQALFIQKAKKEDVKP